jgi:hypothetical protein
LEPAAAENLVLLLVKNVCAVIWASRQACGVDSVRYFDFNLPRLRYDLLRLVFLHRHTGFPPE